MERGGWTAQTFLPRPLWCCFPQSWTLPGLSRGSPAFPAVLSPTNCSLLSAELLSPSQPHTCSPSLSRGEEKHQILTFFLLLPPLLPAGQDVPARRGAETGAWWVEERGEAFPSSPSFLCSPAWRAHIKQEGRGRWPWFPLAVTTGGFCDVDPRPASSGLEFLHSFQLTGLPRVRGQSEAETRGICEQQ